MTTGLRLHSPAGRWAVAASVLGSGAVFIESTVVNVALPALGHEFGLGVAGLQWVVNGYLVTLSALLLLGGALGDAWGHARAFRLGGIAFALSSLLAAIAPSFPLLVAARLVQGAAGALLVPTSLAFLDTAFVEEDRDEAIGVWAGWSAVSTAVGPLLGGALIDFASWRWVFASVVPLGLAAAWITRARLPAPPPPEPRPVDVRGALLISAGLGAGVWALIESSGRGVTPLVVGIGAAGLVLCLLFLGTEARQSEPLLPLGMFRSAQFSGANGTTVLVYAAISTLFFFLMIQLQESLGYGALAAGASLLPINILMLVLSPRAGRWAARSGPGPPLVAGAAVAGIGLALATRIQAGADYITAVLPAVALFGSGLGLLVAPLTTAVLAVAEEGRTGIASAVNNAAARVAGLLAIALVPLAVGIGGLTEFSGPTFGEGFRGAMWIGAVLCFIGAAVAAVTVRQAGPVLAAPHPSPTHACPRYRPVSASSGGSASDGFETKEESMSEACTHLDQVREVTPRTPDGCEECLKTGDTWVHLRVCLTCGHVGCCNSSPNRHASKHYRAMSHPIVGSWEPGETWAWCYADEVYVPAKGPMRPGRTR